MAVKKIRKVDASFGKWREVISCRTRRDVFDRQLRDGGATDRRSGHRAGFHGNGSRATGSLPVSVSLSGVAGAILATSAVLSRVGQSKCLSPMKE